MGHIARATSLTTSLDPRRDGHVLDCSGCPQMPRAGAKKWEWRSRTESVSVSSLRRCLKGEVCLKVGGSYERPGASS